MEMVVILNDDYFSSSNKLEWLSDKYLDWIFDLSEYKCFDDNQCKTMQNYAKLCK